MRLMNKLAVLATAATLVPPSKLEFDFSVNGELENLDKVPDQFKSVYSEQDGKFVLNPDHKGVTDAVIGLNKALTASRNEAKELKKKAIEPKAVIAEIGDFEDAAAVKAHIEGLNAKVEEAANVNPDKLRQEIEATFTTKLEAAQAEIVKRDAAIEKYMVTSVAATALAEAKGNAELLMPHVQRQVKVVESDGEYSVRVLDAQGDFRGDGKGGFMGVADLIGEMAKSDTFKMAFESEKKPGTGTPPKGGPRNPPGAGDDLTPQQKIAQGLKNRQGA